jgi:hypothetical protein
MDCERGYPARREFDKCGVATGLQRSMKRPICGLSCHKVLLTGGLVRGPRSRTRAVGTGRYEHAEKTHQRINSRRTRSPRFCR